MNLIYIGFTLALLLINVAGVTALVGRWISAFPLARATGILLLCTVFFFIEHFIGLGRLVWMWPFTTALSLFLLIHCRKALTERGFWRSETVFLLAFLYGFAWRYTFPDINNSSEHVADLYFISNYLPGHTLPPPDIWYPPHTFTVYYAFQHYGAALMARMFGFSGGLAYNLAIPLLTGMTVALAWYFISHFLQNGWYRALLLIVFVSGANSMSPLVHLAMNPPEFLGPGGQAQELIVGSQRFIGDSEMPSNIHVPTPLGLKLFPPLQEKGKPAPGFQPRQLPEETFGYLYFLGDYHPPLGSFFLLMLALALIAAIETGAIGKLGEGALAFTVPIVMITNPWLFPFQGFLLMAWIVCRLWQKRAPDWRMLIGGGALGFALIFPFLIDFAARSISAPIRPVQSTDHTPWTRFLGMHWTLMLLVPLAMIKPAGRKLAVALALTFGLLLLISEMIYVDDPTGDLYERTNTTMKWWGWIWSGGLIAVGTLCLASPVKFVRWATALMLATLCICVLDVGRYFYYEGKPSVGHLEGDYWYTANPANRDLFNYLKAAPDGIVLESQYEERYTDGGIHALFSGKTLAFGWPAHLDTWRTPVDDVWTMYQQTQQFYRGALPNSLDWLLAHDIRYVVWRPEDSQKNFGVFPQINGQIGSRYIWQGFSEPGAPLVGVWVRKP